MTFVITPDSNLYVLSVTSEHNHRVNCEKIDVCISHTGSIFLKKQSFQLCNFFPHNNSASTDFSHPKGA